jgi:hypothetical protein
MTPRGRRPFDGKCLPRSGPAGPEPRISHGVCFTITFSRSSLAKTDVQGVAPGASLNGANDTLQLPRLIVPDLGVARLQAVEGRGGHAYEPLNIGRVAERAKACPIAIGHSGP